MNKTFLAFYTYVYREDHPQYKDFRNKKFQYAKVVQCETQEIAKRSVLTYLSDKAENDKLIIANLIIEETEVLKE